MSENLIFQQNYVDSVYMISTNCVALPVEYVESFLYGVGRFVHQCG